MTWAARSIMLSCIKSLETASSVLAFYRPASLLGWSWLLSPANFSLSGLLSLCAQARWLRTSGPGIWPAGGRSLTVGQLTVRRASWELPISVPCSSSSYTIHEALLSVSKTYHLSRRRRMRL